MWFKVFVLGTSKMQIISNCHKTIVSNINEPTAFYTILLKRNDYKMDYFDKGNLKDFKRLLNTCSQSQRANL
jgi:hypothetical protein